MSDVRELFNHWFGLVHGQIQELPQRFTEQALIAQREQARGVKKMRIPQLNGQAVSGALAMGGNSGTSTTASNNQEPGPGPDTGWAWSLSELNVEGLATADVVGIYRNDNAIQGHLLWILTGNQPCQTWGKGQKILFEGDRLFVANIGTFTSTAVITLTGVCTQVPGEQIYKLS